MTARPDSLEAARARIIVALDVSDQSEALQLVELLRERPPGLFKVGAQLFTAVGPAIVQALIERGEQVFLDLKFHDIPHIVAEACANAARLGPSLLTVHAAGGPQMLEAAREAVEKQGSERPRLLAVTLLTSLSAAESKRIGFSGSVQQHVVRLAKFARESGCDGVVAAPSDVPALRKACGKEFLIVTPGIYRAGQARPSDQARVATAADAIRAGANYVVVGRGILAAPSPQDALDSLARTFSRGYANRWGRVSEDS